MVHRQQRRSVNRVRPQRHTNNNARHAVPPPSATPFAVPFSLHVPHHQLVPHLLHPRRRRSSKPLSTPTPRSASKPAVCSQHKAEERHTCRPPPSANHRAQPHRLLPPTTTYTPTRLPPPQPPQPRLRVESYAVTWGGGSGRGSSISWKRSKKVPPPHNTPLLVRATGENCSGFLTLRGRRNIDTEHPRPPERARGGSTWVVTRDPKAVPLLLICFRRAVEHETLHSSCKLGAKKAGTLF
jgi:hypothetical protein